MSKSYCIKAGPKRQAYGFIDWNEHTLPIRYKKRWSNNTTTIDWSKCPTNEKMYEWGTCLLYNATIYASAGLVPWGNDFLRKYSISSTEFKYSSHLDSYPILFEQAKARSCLKRAIAAQSSLGLPVPIIYQDAYLLEHIISYC